MTDKYKDDIKDEEMDRLSNEPIRMGQHTADVDDVEPDPEPTPEELSELEKGNDEVDDLLALQEIQELSANLLDKALELAKRSSEPGVKEELLLIKRRLAHLIKKEEELTDKIAVETDAEDALKEVEYEDEMDEVEKNIPHSPRIPPPVTPEDEENLEYEESVNYIIGKLLP
jgi:hypothetical protein